MSEQRREIDIFTVYVRRRETSERDLGVDACPSDAFGALEEGSDGSLVDVCFVVRALVMKAKMVLIVRYVVRNFLWMVCIECG